MMAEWWRADTLPWRPGDTVIARYGHGRGRDQEHMLWVDAGEPGRVVSVHDGVPPGPDRGLSAWATVEWPSGLRDAWSHPDEPDRETDD